MEITNIQEWNDELNQNGFVKIGKLDAHVFSEFKDRTYNLINRYKNTFPSGELFNLINANLEVKTASNKLVEKFLNPYLNKVLNEGFVDVYSVSHIVKPFGWYSGIWHQDSAVVNETVDFSLNAWMPFVDSTKLNGCLWAIPGSHQAKNFKRQFGFNPIDKKFLKKIDKFMVPLEVEAGEVLLFHRNIVHGSSRNWLPMRRIAAESLVTSKNAQFVNFHRDNSLFPEKIIEFKVPVSHFLKANPKEDFYSGETPYVLHNDETKDDIRTYLYNLISQLTIINN